MSEIMKDVRVEILKTDKIPKEYRDQLFEIEYDTFGKIYKNCPKNLKDFDNRYSNKNLILVLCFKENEIIGHRTYEEITMDQIQSMFMVIKKKYRKKKLSNLICSLSVKYFKWIGYKYISSWTHVNISAAQIMNKYAPFVSEGMHLNEIESRLLRNLESYWRRDTNFFGMKRRVKNFYCMMNSEQSGDANFWVHKL